MTESIAIALLKLLLAEAPGVILWVLRQAGLVPNDATHSNTIEPMRRVADVMATNPMHKVRRPTVDPTLSDHDVPDEYKPESD